jgi:hypothetical protein
MKWKLVFCNPESAKFMSELCLDKLFISTIIVFLPHIIMSNIPRPTYKSYLFMLIFLKENADGKHTLSHGVSSRTIPRKKAPSTAVHGGRRPSLSLPPPSPWLKNYLQATSSLSAKVHLHAIDAIQAPSQRPPPRLKHINLSFLLPSGCYMCELPRCPAVLQQTFCLHETN